MDRTSGELVASIMHRFLTLMRYQHRFGHKLRKHLNISGRRLSVLRYLVETGQHTVGEISRFLYIRDATISPLLECMEENGYVRRHRCPDDNRKVLVESTEKGRDMVARAPMGPVWQMRTHLPDLSIEELEVIDKALSRLHEIAGLDETLSR
jgi:DNA-binding MarR family transcriptional regulator